MRNGGKRLRTATVEAPGKVNLALEILGERPDGYHELRSLVMPVSLFETVSVAERADDRVTVETRAEGVDIAPLAGLDPEKHLAVRAVRAMQRLLGRPDRGADVRIVKRVPVGAGMGGGSADAAGVFACLRALWAPDLPESDWLAAGASVGSDVPALQLGGAAVMEGRGERVRRLLAPDEHPAPFWLAVCFPGIPVSTREIYARCKERLTAPPGLWENCLRSVREGDVRAASRSLFNGLQHTASQLCPATERFCTALGAGGALASLLSGSGSAVFGLAEDEGRARALRRSLPTTVWGGVVKTLPDGVMAAHGPLVP